MDYRFTLIAKYRAEAADYRERAKLNRSLGCNKDAAEYDSIAASRDARADALEDGLRDEGVEIPN